MDHPAELPTVLSLCTGYGGIERGLELAGYQHRTIAHVEIEAFAAANLVAKMEAGQLVPAPVWSDLKTLPAHCFRDRVDVLTGGYPCQPFSAAGLRKGAEDPRHLWPYIYDHIRTIKPVRCFFENVEGHISLGLRDVIADLESLGYQTTWGIFSASEVGAPHQRKRVYILAYTSGAGRQQVTRGSHKDEAAHEGRASIQTHIAAGDGEGRGAGAMAYTDSAGQQPSARQPRSPEARHNAGRGSKAMADADSQRQRGRAETAGWQAGPGAEGSAGTNVSDADGQRRRGRHAERQHAEDAGQSPSGTGHDPSGVGSWATEPNVGRVAHGAAFRVDRLRLLGNGVVPQTAAKAWIVLNDQLTNERA
ncbi:cytosine-specific DNA-methyltransferase [uncultured Mediterranean phage uvMED]|nr:cytosine-specific DNA-methyltransferase [uncultured Mediterranean phage uvMED]